MQCIARPRLLANPQPAHQRRHRQALNDERKHHAAEPRHDQGRSVLRQRAGCVEHRLVRQADHRGDRDRAAQAAPEQDVAPRRGLPMPRMAIASPTRVRKIVYGRCVVTLATMAITQATNRMPTYTPTVCSISISNGLVAASGSNTPMSRSVCRMAERRCSQGSRPNPI